MNDEAVDNAQWKFEKEFKFCEMDTMMHRFPPALRDEMNIRYPYMVVPRLVAIGPYHHGKKHLKKMEEVKTAAVAYICERVGIGPAEAMQKVGPVLNGARGKYFDVDEVDVTGFVAMMFRDACFLLLYMDVYHRSYGDKEDHVVSKSMRRFLFSNRECIDNDIMLLENQVPWQVIHALVDLMDLDEECGLSQSVVTFITGMGEYFKITESCFDLRATTYDESNDKYNPPAHLLEVLRRQITKSKPASNNTHISLQVESRPLNSISWMSAMNLEEIGIKLKVIPTETLSDMHLEKGLLHGRLTLAPLLLSGTVASCLVNMAAFEACTKSRFGDHGDKTAVCSYLAVLALLMVETDDVRRVRSMNLLHGAHSDADMLAFFNAVAKHLPSGRHFAFLMEEIKKYKKKQALQDHTVQNCLQTLREIHPGDVSHCYRHWPLHGTRLRRPQQLMTMPPRLLCQNR